MKLGADPINVPVVVTAGSDFYDYADYDIEGTPTNWPASTTLTLEFASGESWAATFGPSGAGPLTDRATWLVDKATADTIAAGTEVWMLYVNGTDDQVLTLGNVERRR